MCASAAPQANDLQVMVVGDNHEVIENLIAALSNGRWTNVPAIRSLMLSNTAIRMDTEDEERIGEFLEVTGFHGLRTETDLATLA
jgi:hypothetical protein